ncbi:MAG: hypothetical protein WCG92_24105 [Hyphomicrobiales bacterium]
MQRLARRLALGRQLREQHRRVARRLQQRVIRRADVAEVAGVEDDLDALVGSRHLAQQTRRAVRRGVVDEDDFVIVLRQPVEDGAHLRDERFNVLRFVKTAGHNADFFHGCDVAAPPF